MIDTAVPAADGRAGEAAATRRGMALGLLGVVMFAMTLPMTRLAVGARAAPQLDPAFVTVGRAAGAGLLSAAWLAWHRIAPPARSHWPALALSALGTVLGFPLFLALALREVDRTGLLDFYVRYGFKTFRRELEESGTVEVATAAPRPDATPVAREYETVVDRAEDTLAVEAEGLEAQRADALGRLGRLDQGLARVELGGLVGQ